MKIRNVILFLVLTPIAVFIAVWLCALTKNYVLTELHRDEIAALDFGENENPLNADMYRVISYSETDIEVYFVKELEWYEIGGIIKYHRNAVGVRSYREEVLWSIGGTADKLIWPYWYHICYYI